MILAKAIQILGDARAAESTPTLVQCLIVYTTDPSAAFLNPNDPPQAQQGHRRQH
jgi:hypothetical protein